MSGVPLSNPQKPQKTFYLETFGCQMNKYDSLLVEGRFQKHGYTITAEPDEADVLLFNTCSVREHAEERVYSWVGELKRRKQERPELVVGVMGCMAQRVGEELFERAGHVDLLVGTRAFHRLPQMVEELHAERERAVRGKRARVVALSLDEQPDSDRDGERIGGTVLWPDGTPVEGAEVRASKLEQRWMQPLVTVVSAADGSFTLGGLEAEPVEVFARHAAPAGAPAMIVLDRRRLSPYTDDATQFDNRHVVRLPGAAQLKALGAGYTNCAPTPEVRLLKSLQDQAAEARKLLS